MTIHGKLFSFCLSSLNFSKDSEGDGIIDYFDDDKDNDGINDANDKIICRLDFIDANFAGIGILVNKSGIFSPAAGEKRINITRNGSEMISFDFNFDRNTFDCRRTVIEKEADSSFAGSILVKGINLGNATKTVYVSDKNPSVNSVCIKDAEINSLNDISSRCNGANELLLSCNNISVNGYACTDLGDKYRISGLHYSGVLEMEPAPQPPTTGGGGGSRSSSGCTPSWECSSWSICTSYETRSRRCTDENNCRNSQSSKPAEVQPCSYEPAKNPVEEIKKGEHIQVEMQEPPKVDTPIKQQYQEITETLETEPDYLQYAFLIIAILISMTLLTGGVVHLIKIRKPKQRAEPDISQLTNYIIGLINDGYQYEYIKGYLLKFGWREDQIYRSFKSAVNMISQNKARNQQNPNQRNRNY